jgi:hypothetical protein
VFDDILDPTVGAPDDGESTAVSLAERPADLAGLRLGLLMNTKRNADAFLEDVAALLRERHGVTPALARTKPSIVHPAPPEMLEEFRAACDVVVVGVGDCGSCSASAVADGLQLEAAGIPAAVICTDAFRVSADAMARVQGSPGYAYVTTGHPVASLSRDGVRERAERALPEITSMLTRTAVAVAS